MSVKKGIIGKKLGMTQIFEADGRIIPVTVIEAGPCIVTQVKTLETDGYYSLQLGFGRKKKLNKPLAGQLKKSHQKKGFLVMKEIRLTEKPENYKPGDQIKADIFKPGELVDATGISIGKGFAGRIKRHHFSRGPMSHGSKCHRLPGSIGATSAGHVLKGTRMAGHLGHQKVTVKNLEVIKVEPDKNLILVKGAVPGWDSNIVVLSWKGKIKKIVPRLVKKDEAKKTEKKGTEKK